MARPLVSVLIDTYNHERFIEQALTSVLQQDFPAADREILIVDDGSQDRTPEIVKKFEPQARLLQKKNGGQASAFNAGIPECQGEIVAFLDGDDWWAPGKLKAVVDALAKDDSVGMVGHGITEMYSDGRQHTELLRETPRFRLNSEAGAQTFRLRKSFLGTSRMTMRADVLSKIGKVPETLTIQADEYLFTMGAIFSDALILRESLTYYRLHDANAFQIPDGNRSSLLRKQRVLETLAKSLRTRLCEEQVSESIARLIIESVEVEAALIRLANENGYPWETVHTELLNYRIEHPKSSLAHGLFKRFSLFPALILPSKVYYSLRRRFAEADFYRRVRQKWLPFQQPSHVDRYRTTRP